MPLELAREMAKHYRTVADWMTQQAQALESGQAQYLEGGQDVSKTYAADLRHRANNIEALIIGYERISARYDILASKPMQNGIDGSRNLSTD